MAAARLSQGTAGALTWTLHEGDSRIVLPTLDSESVDCVVTSPPYYWQRDYEVEGQIGLEASIDGYVENLRTVFRGVKQDRKSTRLNSSH